LEFAKNKWSAIYWRMVIRAASRERIGAYHELHHVIPKSLGGSDSQENLVYLTFREHFIAHRLLVRMTSGAIKKKMVFALWRMCNGKFSVSSHVYESTRVAYVTEMKGSYSGPKSEAHKKALSASAKKRWAEIDQTGHKNANWKGTYVTPFGKFETSKELESAVGNVKHYCKNPDKVIMKAYKNSPHITSADVGKTYRELGFYFEAA
jgi:hypothetical protein